MEVSNKYKRVVDQYLILGSKGKAWMSVYPECKSIEAGIQEYNRILSNPQVKSYLEQCQQALAEQANIEKTRIVNFMYAAICADPLDYIKEGGLEIANNGESIMPPVVKSLSEIPKETRLLIKGLEINKDGTVKIDMYSKEKAVETLNKMLGFYQVDAKSETKKEMTIEEIEARLAELDQIEKELEG